MTVPHHVRGIRSCKWYFNFFRNPLTCLTEIHRRFGPLFALGSPIPRNPRLYVVALSPALNRTILGDTDLFRTTSQGMKGPKGSALNRVRLGLTRMRGEQHRRQRKMLNPMFVPKAVEGLSRLIVEVTREELNEWPLGEVTDAWALVRRLTLRTSSRTLFGRESRSKADALGAIIQQQMTMTFSKGVWLCQWDLPATPYRRMLRNAERMERILREMIDYRRATPTDQPDVLDRLVQARDADGSSMTEGDLIGQMTILFGASYETTATSLSWTLFLLAQHPEVTLQVIEELDSVLGGDLPSYEMLPRLTYLEAVVKESMRVMTPIPYIARHATAATNLGGVELTVGDRVICSPYVTHRLPDLYPDPFRFRPERWDGLEPDQYEYLPFGGGVRFCIGANYAMTVMKMTVAMILQRFRFSIVPDARIDQTVRVTMWPKHGLPMIFHKQDRRFKAVRVHGNVHGIVKLTP